MRELHDNLNNIKGDMYYLLEAEKNNNLSDDQKNYYRERVSDESTRLAFDMLIHINDVKNEIESLRKIIDDVNKDVDNLKEDLKRIKYEKRKLQIGSV